MQDIAIGWLVIPGVTASVVSALWEYLSRKDLRRAESRLLKQEESFRIAHSPRVTAAIDLWTAFCELERCLDASFTRRRAPPEPADTRAEREALAARVNRENDEYVARAWRATTVARDKAEVLLAPETFALFDKAFKAYRTAHSAQRTADLHEARGISPWPSYERLVEHLDVAQGKRADVLSSLQALINGDGRSV